MLDADTSADLRKKLHAKLDSILNLRERPDDTRLFSMLPMLAASMYRDALGDEAFDEMVRCKRKDRLDQLLILLEIGGSIAGSEVEEDPSWVWGSDAEAIRADLLKLYESQPKDGLPTWLVPRGNERSNPEEKEHRRRAVVWQHFIFSARESVGAGIDEVAEDYGVTTKTLRSWIADHSSELCMKRRLNEAAGFLKDDSAERIAAIHDGSVIKIIWMKQRHDRFGRGQPGHYKEHLIRQANEYRRFKGKIEKPLFFNDVK